MKSVLLTLFFLLSVGALHSQKLLVSTKTDKQRILIGEPIQLSLQAIVTGGGKLTWINFDTLPHFEIMSRSKVDTQRIENGILYKQLIVLTSWDSGRWDIPPIALQGSRSLPITIHVDHTPFDNEQPYNEVKTIMEVPKEKATGWHWYLIGIVVLIMLFYLFFPVKKSDEEPGYKGNAYDEAEQQLHLLKNQDLADTDPKLYYTRLVQIFRDYVFRKKRLYSYSKTTDDLMLLIRQFDLPPELLSHLTHTLMVTDMVKFAKYKPAKRENEQSLQDIRQAIITIEKRK